MDHPDGQPASSDAQERTVVLLGRLQRGEDEAANQLLPLVYAQLRALAGTYFRGQTPDHTLQPTALVHEAYLKLVKAADQDWESREHFFAVAATAMRQILMNHAAARRAAKRGGTDAQRVPLEQVTLPSVERTIDIVALDETLTQLAEFDARQARIIELWFFAGFTMEHIAHYLGISVRTVERDWRKAKAWLAVELSEFPA